MHYLFHVKKALKGKGESVLYWNNLILRKNVAKY